MYYEKQLIALTVSWKFKNTGSVNFKMLSLITRGLCSGEKKIFVNLASIAKRRYHLHTRDVHYEDRKHRSVSGRDQFILHMDPTAVVVF